MLELMLKEFIKLAPPSPDFNVKTLEGETVKRITKMVVKLATDIDPVQGQLFTTIPWNHIVYGADKHPEKTREGLISLINILDDYKEKIRSIE
jgi:hypothetical protein